MLSGFQLDAAEHFWCFGKTCIMLHHPPCFYYVPINTQPHYIDWERCIIGYVGHEHIDHIDPLCELWENVELQIFHSQQHRSVRGQWAVCVCSGN